MRRHGLNVQRRRTAQCRRMWPGFILFPAALILLQLTAIAGTAKASSIPRKSKKTSVNRPLQRLTHPTVSAECQPLAMLNQRIDELSRRLGAIPNRTTEETEIRHKIEELEARLRAAEERAATAERLVSTFLSGRESTLPAGESTASAAADSEVEEEAANVPPVNPQGPDMVRVRPAPSPLENTGFDSGRLPLRSTANAEELFKRFGNLRFSGDLRFRLETLDNLGFDNLIEPAARRRLRLRARLALDGVLNRNFDWGLRLASGFFTDPITTNQTMTDFFERKPFALDRAFVRFDSRTDKVGVQLIAGKFEPTFRRTQMVWDDDVNVEGASEAIYYRTRSSLRQIRLVAFQLPFTESANGKDSILYGGQLQTDWSVSRAVSASANVAYYDWQHPDSVVRALGAADTQVNGGIANEAGHAGGQNGFLGTTNRVLVDASGKPQGFRAGFKLFDVLGVATWQATSRLPITVIFDYVRNLSSRIDDEQNGYWAGLHVGQARERGDWLFGYTFTRIQQDAVLVPFNFSDILASNSRAHLPTVVYQVANGVSLQWTGLFSQRVNRTVPATTVNRWLNRMQFDVLYRF